MTRAARHPHYVSTSPFMRWLREQSTLASSAGFTANDLDCVWTNYKQRQVMLVECKCRRSGVSFPQREMLKMLHQALRIGLPLIGWRYRGTHLIQFENESPTDGRIWIDGIEVDQSGLVRFLAFDE